MSQRLRKSITLRSQIHYVAALEDLDAEAEINSVWGTIGDNVKNSVKESLSYYELKKHKPWFVKGSSQLLDQRK
jgi:hypothetical protein